MIMLRGKREDEWSRTSFWCALYANANREKGSKSFSADDFNPMVPEKSVKKATDLEMAKIKNMLENKYFVELSKNK